MIALVCFPSMWAQKGLHINQLFDGRYRKQKNVVETIITGGAMQSAYGIDVYHSVTITGKPQEAKNIEPKVTKDGAKATSREVYFHDGALYYGFYQLPPAGGRNRYILYLNRGRGQRNKLMLVYIEGKAPAHVIKQLLNN